MYDRQLEVSISLPSLPFPPSPLPLSFFFAGYSSLRLFSRPSSPFYSLVFLHSGHVCIVSNDHESIRTGSGQSMCHTQSIINHSTLQAPLLHCIYVSTPDRLFMTKLVSPHIQALDYPPRTRDLSTSKGCSQQLAVGLTKCTYSKSRAFYAKLTFLGQTPGPLTTPSTRTTTTKAASATCLSHFKIHTRTSPHVSCLRQLVDCTADLLRIVLSTINGR